MNKKYEYVEGHVALENFEEGMKALSKAPKKKAAKARKVSASSVPERSPKRKRGN
jgi:hypothetical protein